MGGMKSTGPADRRLLRPKKFVITGGLGFIGSHFVERCLAEGHTVINIDKQTYAANLDFARAVADDPRYTHICQDIAELAALPNCDVIVNFAAESHVDNSISSNDVFVRSNVLGPHRLLELVKNAALRNKLHGWNFRTPLFVQVSTDEVFGDILEGAFKEDDVHTPSNPYSATKSCAEQLVVSWGRTYDIPYIITRTTNNYGPRQHNEKLIPNVITRLLRNDKVIVHGDGSYVRNWVHVLDNVDALYNIVDWAPENDAYHIASDEEWSVRSIVELACRKFDVAYDAVVDSTLDRSGADLRYALDTSKLVSLGIWYQKRTLEAAFDDLIEHYRASAV